MHNEVVLSVKFTREQRAGIATLLVLMVVIQLLYYFYFSTVSPEVVQLSKEEREWLALQEEIDSLKAEKGLEGNKIYPFNPNFISDYKGYVLGMSVAEIDRLHKFRAGNKYVNSAEEFQKLTKVSNAWMRKYAPYFKFPDWVTRKKTTSFNRDSFTGFETKKEKIVIVDINKATQEELMKVYGVGPGLSERILKERDKLGAFVSMEQLQDIWGLSPEVIGNLNRYFKVVSLPEIKKIAINNASLRELQQLPYFRYALAKEIVTYRSMSGEIKSKEDLMKIKNFPIEKVDIIALYLDFK
ncbi:ComEA family DNA-binding protein [Flavobacterium pedocola]